MARKLRGFERVLDAPALFAVAYGEIASSLYIALGIVAGVALGLTPLVLLVAGARVRPRLAVVRGGDDGAARDRRRGDVRPARVQRPRRIRDRMGALPRLPHRHGALGALRAALLRGGLRPAGAARVALGCGRRLLGHRGHRRDPDLPADAAPPRSARRRAPRPRRAGAARRPRARAAALAVHARRRSRLRERPGLGRPRVRAAAGDARLHGSRDGCEPRGGGDRARPDPATLALLGHRARGRRDGSHRRDRPLRLSGRERADGSRRGVARAAARSGSRRRSTDRSPTSSSTRSRSRSGSPASSSSSGRRPRRSRGSRGSRTRSRSTARSRGNSRGSNDAQSCRARRSRWPPASRSRSSS